MPLRDPARGNPALPMLQRGTAQVQQPTPIKTRFAGVLLLLGLISSLSCSNEASDWKKAETTNSLSGYLEFIKKHPTGKSTTMARKRASDEYVSMAFKPNTPPGEAIGMLRTAVAVYDGNDEAWYCLGGFLIPFLHLQDAERALLRALEINPNHYRAHCVLAKLYCTGSVIMLPSACESASDRRLCQVEQAQAHAETAVRIKPDDAWAHLELGAVYLKASDPIYSPDKALESLKRAVDLDPKLGGAHYDLAVAYHSKKMYQAAIMHYDVSKQLGYEPEGIALGGWPTLADALEPHRK